MEIIKIAICDDYKYLCDTYYEIFNMEKNIEVLWTSGSVDECIEKCSVNEPDILMLDIQLESKKEGIDAIKLIKSSFPAIKIIMLTGYDAAEYIFEAFANGASNYVLKEDSDENIIKMINDVYYDSIIVKDEIAKRLIEKSGSIHEQNRFIVHYFSIMKNLTKTEFELLADLSSGKNYRDIAKERFVEENTIRKTASNILKKFKAKNMKELLEHLNKYNVFNLFEE